jgi:CheY-like chemotaxis protein
MTARTETDLQPSSTTTHQPHAATKEARDFTWQGTILLVEDEQSVRSLIARGLRSRGYSVIEASNGVEALEALEQSNVDRPFLRRRGSDIRTLRSFLFRAIPGMSSRRACRKTSPSCRSRSGSVSLSQRSRKLVAILTARGGLFCGAPSDGPRIHETGIVFVLRARRRSRRS